jgi:integrase
MSQHPRKKTPIWRKVPNTIGLYEYTASGTYFANVKHGNRPRRESLRTKDLQLAKRALAAFKARLDRTDPRFGKISFAEWLERFYLLTLKGSEGALKAKRRIVERVKETWPFARAQPMRDMRKSQVLTWLNEQYSGWSDSYWNSALSVVRDALEAAVADRVIVENPAAGLTYRRRKAPRIRLTPSFEQFQAIVADVRVQQFNGHGAEQSGDFIEFLGLAGLGQAEASAIKREHVDLESGRMIIYRRKTSETFIIPIYPQVQALVEKLCEGKKPHERLFAINQARGALTHACRRLGFSRFTQRGLRRMFVTRALEKGIDVKVIAAWQGHRDQGVLILQTYSHVRSEHANRMAALMSTERPANIIPLKEQRV